MTIAQVAIAVERSRDFVEQHLPEFVGVERRGRTYYIPEESVSIWRRAQRVRFSPLLGGRDRNSPVARNDRFAVHRERVRRALR